MTTANGTYGTLSTSFPGRLFVVEGIDGSGKSTQLTAARAVAAQRGLPGRAQRVELVADRQGHDVARGKRRKLLTPLTFSLIHATDFSDRVERDIVPSLKAGGIVLADRYVYTAFARDVVRGVDPALGALALPLRGGADDGVLLPRAARGRAASASCRGGPSSSGTRRAWTSGSTRSPRSPTGLFQSRILTEYEKLVQQFGLQVMDATQPIEVQQRLLRESIRPHLHGLRRGGAAPVL